VLKRLSLLELHLVVGAPDGEPQEVLHQVRLGLEDRTDRRLSDAGCAGDVGEGRRAIALMAESLAGGSQDPLPGPFCLLLTQWRVIGLDTAADSAILPSYSLA
jgi:hypothetical protein